MEIVTKLFGKIGVDENKVIRFDMGIIGFDNLKDFMLIHDTEIEEAKICWLQSIDEPMLALPVINPLCIKEDYNPVVEDELLKNIGCVSESDLLVLCTITVPSEIEKMTANLKAPVIINSNTRKGCQLIVEDEEYIVKYPIYDILTNKREAGE